jgi:tetratricopeptide (TPR) repeat protein
MLIRSLLLIGTVFLCTCLCAFAQGAFPGTGSKADWLKANGFFAEGNQLREGKKYADAVAKYNEAIAVYGSDSHYFYNLGMAQKQMGQVEPAVQSFRKALGLNGRDWKCWKVLGNCLYKMGDLSGARQAFQKAIQNGAPPRESAELHKGIAACSAR